MDTEQQEVKDEVSLQRNDVWTVLTVSDIISYTEGDINMFLIQVQKALITSDSISIATATRSLNCRGKPEFCS